MTRIRLGVRRCSAALKNVLLDNRREIVANAQRVGLEPVDRSHHRRRRPDFNSLEIHLPTKHTKDTKISEAKIDGFMFPWQQTLVFHSRIMAKVHDQA